MHLGIIASLAVFNCFVKYVRCIIARHNKDLICESRVASAILDYEISGCKTRNRQKRETGLRVRMRIHVLIRCDVGEPRLAVGVRSTKSFELL
jgi:hypothetical protein